MKPPHPAARKARTKTTSAFSMPKGCYVRGKTWWFTWYQDGEKKFTSLHTDIELVAAQRAVGLRQSPKLHSNDRLSGDVTTFLAMKKSTGHYRRHSAEWAKTPLERFATFAGDCRAVAVTPELIPAFWAELRQTLADTSASSYMRALRSFFSWLVQEKRIVESPMTGFKTPKVTQAGRIVFCEAELRDKLITEAPTRDLRLILFLGMHAGLRKNEIIEARPEWVDVNRGLLSVQRSATFESKDRETRSVPLTRTLVAFLRESDLGSPFLLRPEVKHGKSGFRYDFRKPFETYMEAQKCPWVTPHVMRHTFSAQYLSNGGSLYRLAKYLGDTIEVTEKHYGHLVLDREDIERGHL